MYFVYLALLVTTVLGLYEDQVGKLDWRLQHVGSVKYAYIDTQLKHRQIIVASEENVVASLSLTSGKLGWRHVMEEGAVVLSMFSHGGDAITVTDRHVRKWDAQGGQLIWDYALEEKLSETGRTVLSNDQLVLAGVSSIIALSVRTGSVLWSLNAPWSSLERVLVCASEDSILASTTNGEQTRVWTIKDEIISQTPTAMIGIPQSKDTRCTMDARYLACVNPVEKSLHVLDMTSKTLLEAQLSGKWDSSPTFSTKDITVYEHVIIVQGYTSGCVFAISNNKLSSFFDYQGVGSVTTDSNGDDVLVTVTHVSDSELKVSVLRLADGSEDKACATNVKSLISANVRMVIPYLFKKAGSTCDAYRIFVVFEDDTLAVVRQAEELYWLREEGLASITAVEFVDLPVSDVEAQMEEEFGSKTGNLVTMFVGRLITQASQLYSFFLHSYHKHVTGLRVVAETEDHMILDEDYLTRDAFNLHKMIVAVSRAGKVFGVDSSTGKIIWTHFVKDIQAFTHGNAFLLYIQRTTAHFPHQPIATLIGNAKCQSCGSVIFSFNPITGKTVEKVKRLGYQAKQAMLISQMTEDFQHPILVLDSSNQVHVYPENSALDGKQEFYMFTAQLSKSQLNGYVFKGKNLMNLKSYETWSVQLGENHSIVSLRSRPSHERMHTLGKVLPDRSIFYKYANPNMVAVVTQSDTGTDLSQIEIHLIDGVSGRILFSCDHKKSSGPVHLIHSENWVVYSYYSDRSRRSEIAVLELYEGGSQSNATDFSSLETNIRPIVMRQAYVLSMGISALATTLTEKGITGKNILLARTAGGIVEVPKAFLDPRRPLEQTQASREEGIPMYMPELPLSFEGTINYNQSVFRIREIHSDASGLESTSLILAYGLDVFHTRMAPSKMYDVLKDDFDFLFIGGVTVGMIVVSVLSRKFALRKMISKAWK